MWSFDYIKCYAKESFHAMRTHNNIFWKIRSFFPKELMLKLGSEGWLRVKVGKKKKKKSRSVLGITNGIMKTMVEGTWWAQELKESTCNWRRENKKHFGVRSWVLLIVPSTLTLSLDCVHFSLTSLLLPSLKVGSATCSYYFTAAP